MKKYLVIPVLLTLVMTLQFGNVSALENPPEFRLASGLMISPNYHNYNEKLFDDYLIIGGYGFINVQGSLHFDVAPQIRLMANLDGYFNYFSGDLNFVNLIGAPSVSTQFSFKQVGSSPFIRVDLHKNYAYTSYEFGEWDGGGFAVNFIGGYRFSDGGEFELGYVSLPIDVGRISEENFGGFMLRYRYEAW